MNLEELEQKVIEWADTRNLLKESTASYQCAKLDEEYRELCKAVLDNDKLNVCDSIGDMMVVMTIISRLYDLTLSQCYAYAYNEIKDRKGKMVNGIFVKE